MAGAQAFKFDDQGSFDENLNAFAAVVTALDSMLAPILIAALAKVDIGPEDRGGLLDGLQTEVRTPAPAIDHLFAKRPLGRSSPD